MYIEFVNNKYVQHSFALWSLALSLFTINGAAAAVMMVKVVSFTTTKQSPPSPPCYTYQLSIDDQTRDKLINLLFISFVFIPVFVVTLHQKLTGHVTDERPSAACWRCPQVPITQPAP